MKPAGPEVEKYNSLQRKFSNLKKSSLEQNSLLGTRPSTERDLFQFSHEIYDFVIRNFDPTSSPGNAVMLDFHRSTTYRRHLWGIMTDDEVVKSEKAAYLLGSQHMTAHSMMWGGVRDYHEILTEELDRWKRHPEERYEPSRILFEVTRNNIGDIKTDGAEGNSFFPFVIGDEDLMIASPRYQVYHPLLLGAVGRLDRYQHSLMGQLLVLPKETVVVLPDNTEELQPKGTVVTTKMTGHFHKWPGENHTRKQFIDNGFNLALEKEFLDSLLGVSICVIPGGVGPKLDLRHDFQGPDRLYTQSYSGLWNVPERNPRKYILPTSKLGRVVRILKDKKSEEEVPKHPETTYLELSDLIAEAMNNTPRPVAESTAEVYSRLFAKIFREGVDYLGFPSESAPAKILARLFETMLLNEEGKRQEEK